MVSTVNLRSAPRSSDPDLRKTGIIDFSDEACFTGINGIKEFYYQRIGEIVYCLIKFSGTFANERISCLTPFPLNIDFYINISGYCVNNNTVLTTAAKIGNRQSINYNIDPKEVPCNRFEFNPRADEAVNWTGTIALEYALFYNTVNYYPKYNGIVDYANISSTVSVTGYSSTTTKACYYQKIGNIVHVYFDFRGTSNATTLTATLPYASLFSIRMVNGRILNNGVSSTTSGMIELTEGSTTMTLNRDANGTAWTASGTKIFIGQIFYFTND